MCSVFMAAAIGSESIKPKRIAVLDKSDNQEGRSAVALAIDRIFPQRRRCRRREDEVDDRDR